MNRRAGRGAIDRDVDRIREGRPAGRIERRGGDLGRSRCALSPFASLPTLPIAVPIVNARFAVPIIPITKLAVARRVALSIAQQQRVAVQRALSPRIVDREGVSFCH